MPAQILGIMSVYPGTDSVLEPALGLLTSMMLRLPDVVLKAAEVSSRGAVSLPFGGAWEGMGGKRGQGGIRGQAADWHDAAAAGRRCGRGGEQQVTPCLGTFL